jgi:maltose alpha-D-glucosyltransferase / alpha-amylase
MSAVARPALPGKDASPSGPDAPVWYRDGVIYELHVRAFADSNGDGIGDFVGLTSRLDYLADLGVTALWLLPFYPSPLRDDGYDIADYLDVHRDYGTLRDFKRFLREAKARDLRVITELVLNHTSDQHPWFQRARRAPSGSRWRDFYVWSDTPDRYADARIIFGDFESSNWTWDPVAGAYFWHRFYSHQPDLNFDNPEVRREMRRVLDFWLDLGVDGLRLDAVPYLFEREGTNCENLDETHGYLKELRRHVDESYSGRMLLAEANQWPEDAAAYFGDGDECHMNFHFPVMPRLFMALRMEDRTPILDILEQTPRPPEGCQWAMFLRNHDELTLEMVTDEERDYMYRVYARDPQMRINLGIRRRLAPLLDNDRRRIELMNALLFSLPGTPVLYYGDELGMGDNVYLGDRNGVRTPMQWSPDRNGGFSQANPHRLYLPLIAEARFHHEALNVEAQLADPSSLMLWTRQLVSLRRRHPVFARGELHFLEPDNQRVLAFVRHLEGHAPVVVVANLSRLAQQVQLDLRPWAGAVPVEVLGGTPFRSIGEQPYDLTLAPYGFYWLRLEQHDRGVGAAEEVPYLDGSWPRLVGSGDEDLCRVLVAHARRRRWFAGKNRAIRAARIAASVPLPTDEAGDLTLVILEVDYREGEPDAYVLLLVELVEDRAAGLALRRPDAVVARLPGERILADAMADDRSAFALAKLTTLRRGVRGRGAAIHGWTSPEVRAVVRDGGAVTPLDGEQSNSSVVLGGRLMLKVIRRVLPGENPDLEMTRYLATERRFRHVPRPLGSLTIEVGESEASTLLLVHELIHNEGDAWAWTQHQLALFHERTAVHRGPGPAPDRSGPWAPPEEADGGLDAYLESVARLALRCAAMHIELGRGEGPSMRPEQFTAHYQRALYQSLRAAPRAGTSTRRRGRGPTGSWIGRVPCWPSSTPYGSDGSTPCGYASTATCTSDRSSSQPRTS